MNKQMQTSNKYDLVFVVTYIDLSHIDNLLQSVFCNNKTVSILFVLIEQGENVVSTSQYFNPNISIVKIKIAIIVGLSIARNKGLNYLNEFQVKFDHVMFPDDDSSFSTDFFSNYKYVIEANKCYLIDVFFLNTMHLYRPNSLKDLQRLHKWDYQSAMSVNLVVCKPVLTLVGDFDEKMGVGSTYGAAEDSDFYLRCLSHGADFYYSKQLFNFHPHYENKYEKMPLGKLCKRFKAYGMGVEYFYCKHRMYCSAIFLLFRAIGGSVLNLFMGKIPLSIAYMYSFYYRLIVFVKKIW